MPYREVIVEREAPLVRRSNGTAVALGVLGAVVLLLLLWFVLMGGPRANVGGTRTEDRNAPAETSDKSTEEQSGEQSKVGGEGSVNIDPAQAIPR
jgi:hypothetical protein